MVSVLWLFLKARRISCRLPSADRNRSRALGALFALSTLALNKALEIIPVAIAILIYYTYPLLTGIASWVTGTVRFSARAAVTMMVAFLAVPFFYGVAIFSTMAAVNTVGAVKTSFYMNFEPVATISFSALILDLSMSRTPLVGARAVIAALLLFRMLTAKAG